MRVMNKRFATKVVAGVLSVVPMAQAGAAKASTLTTKAMHSTEVLAQASSNLRGVSKDTYYAANNFVKKPQSGVRHSKVATGHKTTHVAEAVVDLNQRLANYGARLIKTTEESQIYDVPVQSASKLNVLALERFKGNIADIKIAVPKQNSNLKASDCLIVCTTKTRSRVKLGYNSEIRHQILVKGNKDVAFVEDEEIKIPGGGTGYFKSYYRSERVGHTQKYKDVGFMQTRTVTDDGQQSINYSVIGRPTGDPVVEEAQFDMGRDDVAGRFEDLLFDEPGAAENQREAVSPRIKTPQRKVQKPKANTMSTEEFMQMLQEQTNRAQQQINEQNDRFRDADTQKWKDYYEHRSVTVPHYGY